MTRRAERGFRTLIEAPELRSRLDDPSWLAVDCRSDLADPAAGRRAYEAGHLPGAVHADLERDLSAPVTPATGRHPLPAPDAFGETLARWGVGPDTQVVAYDAGNGMFAPRLWWMLRWVGHERAAVLDGGYAAWVGAGGPVTTAPPRRERAPFVPRPRNGAWCDAAGVSAALAAGGLLVDARAPERFRGEVEPIDAVAGHVPGAVNHPFPRNLGEDGRFLPPAELARRWRALLAGRRGEDVICMCGSGVTACHHLLALEHAGIGGARLYAGSWSEWIRDPARPVVCGP